MFIAQLLSNLWKVGFHHLTGPQEDQVAIGPHARQGVALGHLVRQTPDVVVEGGRRHASSWLRVGRSGRSLSHSSKMGIP